MLYIGLFLFLFLFLFLSRKEKNYLNILVFYFLFFIPSNFIFVILYEYFFIPIETSIGYYYVYTTYCFLFLSFYLGYNLKVNLPKLNFLNHQNIKYRNKVRFLAILFFILAWVVYLPILIEFREYILNPREIYIRTRSGYGLSFFLSTTLMYISLILVLFSVKNKLYIGIYICMLIIFGYLHGAKGMIVTSFIICALYAVYIEKIKVNIKVFVFMISFFSIFVIISFLFTTNGLDSFFDIIKMMSAYSDYTRNSIELINNFDNMFKDYFWGQLTFESNFWSRIPRFFFENKPRAFGEFRLSEVMFPEWFEQNVGDASFGIIGIPFADFSFLSCFYISFWSLITGIIIRYLITILYDIPNVGLFILLCFFCSYGFISTGSGWMLFEHLFLAYIINKIISVKVIYKGKK